MDTGPIEAVVFWVFSLGLETTQLSEVKTPKNVLVSSQLIICNVQVFTFIIIIIVVIIIVVPIIPTYHYTYRW